MQFLEFVEDFDESKYPQVNAIRYPLSLLIKVPVTNKLRFAYRQNLFLGSQLKTKAVLEGHFLAYHKYIDDTS